MPSFRVMTYNILWGGAGREELIRDVVRAIHPDVAVFTEVTAADSFDAIATVVGPHRVSGASRSRRERPAIVSRWPIIPSDLQSSTWSAPQWVAATVRPLSGPPVTIHGVHLAPHALWPFELRRHLEVRALLKRLGARVTTPQIIAGDFNALIAGLALKPLIDAGYVDCYGACRPQEDGFSVPAWNPSARIDYIFASPDLKSSVSAAGISKSFGQASNTRIAPSRSLAELLGWKAVRSLGGEASDHLPVWADFEWPQDPAALGAYFPRPI
jgi:endonuclease/exonuclease/phosphatase family metal-dependent hydrolase